MTRFVFGPFLLDLGSRALLRDGESLNINARTFDTLVVLVQNRGRLVDKDELLSLIWPDTVVNEVSLSQTIFAARKALGDNPRDHRYIATIPGRGYQFVAAAEQLNDAVSSGQAAVSSTKREASPMGVEAVLSRDMGAVTECPEIIPDILAPEIRALGNQSQMGSKPSQNNPGFLRRWLVIGLNLVGLVVS